MARTHPGFSYLRFIPINDDDEMRRMLHAMAADPEGRPLPGDSFVSLSDHEGIFARISGLLSVRQ